ncbi:hypothetical protein ACE193_21120 [Bernardetia sp. OM2101]|uniref:hypothetical protein n=1 Tax=Bernardetia sp. OM2101 TaxID=3344876 RepID=UPI0035D0FEA0
MSKKTRITIDRPLSNEELVYLAKNPIEFTRIIVTNIKKFSSELEFHMKAYEIPKDKKERLIFKKEVLAALLHEIHGKCILPALEDPSKEITKSLEQYIKSWLYHLSKAEERELTRYYMKHSSSSLDEDTVSDKLRTPSPALLYMKEAINGLKKHFLKKRKNELWNILYLKSYCGYSLGEIAEKLNKPYTYGAIKQKHYIAKEIALDFLKNNYGGDFTEAFID